MSREQTAIRPDYVTCGPHLSGWLVSLGFSTRKNAQDAHEIIARHGIAAPTVSGGEGWEELERVRDLLRQIWEADTHQVWQGNPPEPSHDEEGDCAKLAGQAVEIVNALIAVARGGGALREQARSVPTEGHGAAVVALRETGGEDGFLLAQVATFIGGLADAYKLKGAAASQAEHYYGLLHRLSEQNRAALAQCESSFESSLGGDFAQQNEPNTLPTVQAETAVVETVECETCGGSGKIVEEARTTGPNQHSACQMDCENCDGTGKATGETQ